MTLWIVEDEDMEVKKIREAVQKQFSKLFDIYLNRDLIWPADRTLPRLEPDPGFRPVRSPEHLPDIVILDLLLIAPPEQVPIFAGAAFYKRLREEEEGANRWPSQVIVYSQYRGFIATENFVQECREDNHFDDVVKSPALLMQKLGKARQKVLGGD